MNKNTKFTAVFVVTVVIGMIGLSYAAVPLYDLFCRTTGFGGTPVTLKEDTKDAHFPVVNIKVQFNSDVAGGLNWKFIPVEREVIVKTGTNNLAFYTAKNLSESAVTGIATFNVTPPKIGKYFSKIDCFCFVEQLLNPGQSVEMPVTFFIDPEIFKDENVKEVSEITLSYTFMKSLDQSKVILEKL